jgi:hypothetical protein
MLNIQSKVITKSEPHSIRFNWSQVEKSPGVYKVVYPQRLAENYKGVRFVSIDGRVIYVHDYLFSKVSLIGLDNGWSDNKSEFEQVDAKVEIVITEN